MSKHRKGKSGGRWKLLPAIGKGKKASDDKPIVSPSDIPADPNYLITGLIFTTIENGQEERRCLVGHTTAKNPDLVIGLMLPDPAGRGFWQVTSKMYPQKETVLVEMLQESDFGIEMLKVITERKGIIYVPLTVFFVSPAFHAEGSDIPPDDAEGVDVFDCSSCQTTTIGFNNLCDVKEPAREIPEVWRASQRRASVIDMTEMLSYGIVSSSQITFWDVLSRDQRFSNMCNECRVREIEALTEKDIVAMFLDEMQAQP